jgi:hypothetical protein
LGGSGVLLGCAGVSGAAADGSIGDATDVLDSVVDPNVNPPVAGLVSAAVVEPNVNPPMAGLASVDVVDAPKENPPLAGFASIATGAPNENPEAAGLIGDDSFFSVAGAPNENPLDVEAAVSVLGGAPKENPLVTGISAAVSTGFGLNENPVVAGLSSLAAGGAPKLNPPVTGFSLVSSVAAGAPNVKPDDFSFSFSLGFGGALKEKPLGEFGGSSFATGFTSMGPFSVPTAVSTFFLSAGCSI